MNCRIDIRWVGCWLAGWLSMIPVAEVLAAPSLVPIGAAKIDITPRWPVRLGGYAKRQGTNWQVERPLQARALALGEGANTAVVVTLELLGVTAEISDGLAGELAKSHGLTRDRVAVCAIHTHSGPALDGLLSKGLQAISGEEREAIARYTTWLRERLREVAMAALEDRRPAQLVWAQGQAGFAVNRRELKDGKWSGFGVVPDGPVDRSLPVMAAVGADGARRAVFTSYACHCTTLGGGLVVHSDWAGEAAARIEADYPGSVALVAVGCGGDARPYPGGTIEAAQAHGREIAAEVARLLDSGMRPLPGVTSATYRVAELPLDAASGRGTVERVPLPVQTWSFGNELAMVFLGGEVVADYSLRLRRELDADRLWINAYANAVPCYVASRRLYAEGGYEVDASMLKYGWPGRLAVGTEDRLIEAVHSQMQAAFRQRAAR